MEVIKVILPIVVGAVIGYFTNFLAIKMMFRPRHEVRIGKFQLPFTPGIIPKNQKRMECHWKCRWRTSLKRGGSPCQLRKEWHEGEASEEGRVLPV